MPVPPRVPGLIRALVTGCLMGLCLGLLAETVRVVAGDNFHTVIPGRVYRCAQQSGQELRRLVEETKVRTVINLRGCCVGFDWYQEQCRTTHALGVSQEDVCLSASRLPSTHEIRRLAEVLERSAPPLLIHCRRGADRTGLASALALLLLTDASLEEARHQLGPRYGHVAIGRTAQLDRFLTLYEEWLATQARAHSPAALRRWLTHDYVPAECRCRFEVLEAPPWVQVGRSSALRVRVHNTSLKPWRFSPGTRAGISLTYFVVSPSYQRVAEGLAGLFKAEVAPGDSIDLTVALPAFTEPGLHTVTLHMANEQHCSFFQTGQEPFLWGVEVLDTQPALHDAFRR